MNDTTFSNSLSDDNGKLWSAEPTKCVTFENNSANSAEPYPNHASFSPSKTSAGTSKGDSLSIVSFSPL